MDEELREAFRDVNKGIENVRDKISEKIDEVHGRITEIQVNLTAKEIKTETRLKNHCDNKAIHIGPEGNGNGDKVNMKFKFPRRWLLVMFYLVLALLGGVGFKEIFNFLSGKI